MVGVVRDAIVLAAVLTVSSVSCGLWGVWRGFGTPWLAAAVAGGICWSAGLLGLLSVQWATRRSPAHGPLVGVVVRMAIPLPIGIALHRSGGMWAESHVFSMIVISYLVMLTTETLLLVKSFSASKPAGAVGANDSMESAEIRRMEA